MEAAVRTRPGGDSYANGSTLLGHIQDGRRIVSIFCVLQETVSFPGCESAQRPRLTLTTRVSLLNNAAATADKATKTRTEAFLTVVSVQ
jgi:hypothetical protein